MGREEERRTAGGGAALTDNKNTNTAWRHVAVAFVVTDRICP